MAVTVIGRTVAKAPKKWETHILNNINLYHISGLSPTRELNTFNRR